MASKLRSGKFLMVKLLPMREFTVFRLHVSSTCVLPAVLNRTVSPCPVRALCTRKGPPEVRVCDRNNEGSGLLSTCILDMQ